MRQLLIKLSLILFFLLFLVGCNKANAQDSCSWSSWKLKYLKDEFGDNTKECFIQNLEYNYSSTKVIYSYSLSIDAENKRPYLLIILNDYFEQIPKEGIDVRLSVKLTDNTVIDFNGFNIIRIKEEKFVFVENKRDYSISRLIDLMKNNLELKIAIKVTGYKAIALKIDCKCFMKAYNDLLNCKPAHSKNI
jgi:hypothetical protein